MHRKFIAETSGHSFLRKFRNCLEALEEEIQKLETITQDLQNPNLPRTYFKPQADFLSCIDSVLVDAEKCHEEILAKLINVDHVENRLLKVRERLLRFEEDPKLLALGYQPFVPKDSIQLSEDDDEDSSSLTSTNDDHQAISDFDDLNDNQQQQQQQEKVIEDFSKQLSLNTDTVDTPKSTKKENQDESFNILSTVRKNKQKNGQFQPKQEKSAKKKKTKIDAAKINNPMLARAFALCDRWIKDDQADSSLDQSTIQNDDCVDATTAHDNNSNGNSNPKPNVMKPENSLKSNSSSVKMNTNFTPSVRNRLFRLAENRPSDNSQHSKITPKPSVKKNIVKKTIKNEQHFVQLEEYETVEFTPGMTTKVRKSGDGKNP